MVQLTPKRPHLALRAPRARAGGLLEATLFVDAERTVTVDRFVFELHGQERARTGDRADVRELCRLTAQSRGAARAVPPGRTIIGVAFQLPRTLSPSYQGLHFSVDYRISARADIPWWPDATGEWGVVVDAARDETPGSALEDGVALPGGGTLELQLDTGRIVIGGRLRGRLTVSGAVAPASQVEVALVALEKLTFTDAPQVEAARVPLGRLPPRARTDFELAVPPDLTASFAGRLASLDWQLQASVRGARGPVAVRLPVQLTRDVARDRAVPLPTVSAARSIDEVWQATAERFGLTYQDGGLEGAFGACQVEVVRQVRMARPTVRATLRFPSLRLGLSCEPRPASPPTRRGLLVVNGDDALYHLSAREPHQLDAVLLRLGGLLSLLPRTSLGDDRLVVTQFDSGRDLDQLLGLVENLSALANQLEAMRNELPPPAASDDLAAWQELAAGLHGELSRGDLSIVGRLRGARVEVQPRWSPEPSLRLSIGLIHAPRAGLGPQDVSRLTAPAAAALALASGGAPCRLELERGALVLTVDAIVASPHRLEARLSALYDLAEQLAGSGRPYR